MQKMHGVVKSIVVEGQTTEGKLAIEVSASEANLSTGRWRICISFISLSQQVDEIVLLPITLTVALSTNPTTVKVWNSTHQQLIEASVPSKVIVSVFQNDVTQNPKKLDFNGHWMEMQRPANIFFLLFEYSKVDTKEQDRHYVPLNAYVHAHILVERLA